MLYPKYNLFIYHPIYLAKDNYAVYDSPGYLKRSRKLQEKNQDAFFLIFNPGIILFNY
jgi:hypothetical protein